MRRLSINEMTTFRWSFEEDVARYAACGVPAIGVWRQKLSDYGEEKGIELLHESGLHVSNLLWAGGFTGSDGRCFKEAVADAREAIQLAAQLRTNCVAIYSGARAGHTHNHARRLVRDGLSSLADFAAEHAVTLALEPMHEGCAAGFTFLTQLDDTLSLLDEVDSPYIQLAFDTYHLGHDPSVLDRIPQIVSQLAIVRLGDSRRLPDCEQNRAPLGEGVLPLRDVVQSLMHAGYDGYYDVFLIGEDVEDRDYLSLLLHSQQAYHQFRACEPVHKAP